MLLEILVKVSSLIVKNSSDSVIVEDSVVI